MALDPEVLKTELLKMLDPTREDFIGFPADGETAAANWAAAFDAYAASAEDASGDTLASANASGFESAIETGLIGQPEEDPPVPGSSTPAEAAAAFGLAATAYWTGATFAVGQLVPTPPPCPNVGAGTMIFATEVSSAVVAPLSALLVTALLAEFAVISDDADAKADAIANAFDTSTTTEVLVLISGLDTTPPPASPLPVTNTCNVF